MYMNMNMNVNEYNEERRTGVQCVVSPRLQICLRGQLVLLKRMKPHQRAIAMLQKDCPKKVLRHKIQRRHDNSPLRRSMSPNPLDFIKALRKFKYHSQKTILCHRN